MSRPSVSHPPASAHPVFPDRARQMAKAEIRKTDHRARIAAVVTRVTGHLALKEVQDLIERATDRKIDERTIARWQRGEERPQFDALFAVQQFGQPLLIAFAELVGEGIEIQTVVTMRRLA